MEPVNNQEERVYRWTSRGLYLMALAANVLLIWSQIKDTPEVTGFRAKMRNVKDEALRPLKERERFRRHANQVIFEATEVVEEARENNAD